MRRIEMKNVQVWLCLQKKKKKWGDKLEISKMRENNERRKDEKQLKGKNKFKKQSTDKKQRSAWISHIY